MGPNQELVFGTGLVWSTARSAWRSTRDCSFFSKVLHSCSMSGHSRTRVPTETLHQQKNTTAIPATAVSVITMAPVSSCSLPLPPPASATAFNICHKHPQTGMASAAAKEQRITGYLASKESFDCEVPGLLLRSTANGLAEMYPR